MPDYVVGFQICLKDCECGILPALVDGLWWKRIRPEAQGGVPVL